LFPKYSGTHTHTYTHTQHLTARFWPLDDVETDAILHLNEDTELTVDEVSMFWREGRGEEGRGRGRGEGKKEGGG